METYFIIHEDDSSVKTYKLNILDKNKCNTMLEKYSELSFLDKKEQTVEYASGLVNTFLGNKDKWYQELIQKYTTIDLASDIAHLEEVNNNEINFVFPSRIYFVEFHDR